MEEEKESELESEMVGDESGKKVRRSDSAKTVEIV